MNDDAFIDDDEGDEDFTIEELETIANGIRDLGLIDALMAALLHSLGQYAREDIVAPSGTGIGNVLRDSIELVGAWKEFAASPFGAQFDPRIDPPDEEDE